MNLSTHPALGCTAIPFGYLSPVTMSLLDLSVTLNATTDLYVLVVQNKTLDVQS